MIPFFSIKFNNNVIIYNFVSILYMLGKAALYSEHIFISDKKRQLLYCYYQGQSCTTIAIVVAPQRRRPPPPPYHHHFSNKKDKFHRQVSVISRLTVSWNRKGFRILHHKLFFHFALPPLRKNSSATVFVVKEN